MRAVKSLQLARHWLMRHLLLSTLLSSALGCTTNAGCSHNGVCSSGSCNCESPWSGATCSTLTVGLATVDNGYRPSNTYTWGGAVMKDDTDTYHMWVSEIANNCHIDKWARNSMTVHATSSSADGPYTKVDTTWGTFSHEVEVTRAPTGEYVAFFTAAVDGSGNVGDAGNVVPSPPAPAGNGAACTCTPADPSPSSCATGASTDPTVMSYAMDPAGPWSTPVVVLQVAPLGDGIDANFAATITASGGLVGLWRTYPGGSQVHWVTGTDWKDPTTYTWQDDETPLFPSPYDGLTPEGLEDMYAQTLDAARCYPCSIAAFALSLASRAGTCTRTS